MTRELGPTRAVAATHPIAVVFALVAANVAIVAFVVGRPEWAPLALAALVAIPILAALVVKLVERPQRGVLLLAALIPLDGLHEIVPYPSGWKEALVLVTLAATAGDHAIVNVCSGRPISVRTLVEAWIAENRWSIDLALGHVPYPDYEPMAFWGDPTKLHRILAQHATTQPQ